ncbi:MAG: ATP-binding protein involved in chromosome partitioning [Actinomycetota bacterium]|jgi:ATP-binding protein involved in chromosome partitioning|nr:ATP-binding protein involved in chromosome partitioning [Actinomycetota bacterium]
MPTVDAITAALASVNDPEINRPITELGMVKSVDVAPDGSVRVAVYLTVSGCPMKGTITERVTSAVEALPGVTSVEVVLDVMSDEQRAAMKELLRGHGEREIPFAQPGSLTKVYAIASGKGGVGKSSVTANLAVAMAQSGLTVGLVDADVYGHSIPRMLNAVEPPTMVEGMIMPPQAYGVRVISMLPFKPGGVSQPVAFRGPMLHRALQQFLADVWWGDLDVLLLDLPPGTGDVAISTAQLLPNAEIVVVTTPQPAAADVAVRAGTLAEQTHQKVAGVIENMSSFPCPHCGEPLDLFGFGGGAIVAETISSVLGTPVPLLGQIPFDVALREGGDSGRPLVLSNPDAPASLALLSIAQTLGQRPRGLAGMSLGITPARRAT